MKRRKRAIKSIKYKWLYFPHPQNVDVYIHKMHSRVAHHQITNAPMAPDWSTFPVYVLSVTCYGMEYSFGHFKSDAMALFPPSSLWISSLSEHRKLKSPWKAPLSNNYINVLSTLFSHQMQTTALYQLLGSKRSLFRVKPDKPDTSTLSKSPLAGQEQFSWVTMPACPWLQKYWSWVGFFFIFSSLKVEIKAKPIYSMTLLPVVLPSTLASSLLVKNSVCGYRFFPAWTCRNTGIGIISSCSALGFLSLAHISLTCWLLSKEATNGIITEDLNKKQRLWSAACKKKNVELLYWTKCSVLFLKENLLIQAVVYSKSNASSCITALKHYSFWIWVMTRAISIKRNYSLW